MFKVDLKTKKIETSNNKLPSVNELMPNPGFKLVLKKPTPVKTF